MVISLGKQSVTDPYLGGIFHPLLQVPEAYMKLSYVLAPMYKTYNILESATSTKHILSNCLA